MHCKLNWVALEGLRWGLGGGEGTGLGRAGINAGKD